MNKNHLISLKTERDVFGIISGDFVVKAVYTFAHESYICFVMEYMFGGDFGTIIHKYGCLDEDIARFYIGEIILAVDYMHKVGIIHRDLKPDNLLLNSQGHLKLTDFGLSDMGMQRRNMNASQFVLSRRRLSNLNKMKSVKLIDFKYYNDKPT